MSAETLIQEARSEGVAIMLSPGGKILLSGRREDRERWAGILKPHREEVVALLSASQAADIPARCWRVRLPNETLIVSTSPAVTRGEIQGLYPDAAIELAKFHGSVPRNPLTAGEKALILDWLQLIGEEDQETIEEVLRGCQRDAKTKGYFLARAGEVPCSEKSENTVQAQPDRA
jgi:hypothetical protein